MTLTEEAASPAEFSDTEPRKLNMYMVLFSRVEGSETTAESISVYNSICKGALAGLTGAQF